MPRILVYFVSIKTANTFQPFKMCVNDSKLAWQWRDCCKRDPVSPQSKADQIHLWIFNQATPTPLYFPVVPLHLPHACFIIPSISPILLFFYCTSFGMKAHDCSVGTAILRARIIASTFTDAIGSPCCVCRDWGASTDCRCVCIPGWFGSGRLHKKALYTGWACRRLELLGWNAYLYVRHMNSDPDMPIL